MPPYESNCTALDTKRAPVLRLRPRLEVVEGDGWKLTAERGARLSLVLASAFLVIALTFVWRSFYAMRIQREGARA